MKRVIGITVIMLAVAMGSICVGAEDWSGRRRQISGRILNAVTGAYISDSIRVEVLSGDSTVVGTGYNTFDYSINYREGDEEKYAFGVMIESPGENFVIRLSHPDYATAYYPFELKSYSKNIGLLNMRKLTNFERGIMLDEVVVKGSVIQVVNKGDTLQYNADAFAVAQGSMLDALIEQMPGVELRDNGQIYVNGRFVDKLLLDGKDFFQGNQFVLLQNLPAYTVKNVKVYEQASASREVFGRKDATDPDKYVMDVTLKKGYNAGYIANAEAGGGSHNRYRGRAFGAMYNRTFRIGGFGYANNLNESRNPGRNGDWSPASSTAGLTTTKAGGVSYGYFAPDRTVEVTGTTSGQYEKTDRNTLTNTQTFLSGGDSYTLGWNDNKNRNFGLTTSNSLTLRPKEGNGYNQLFTIDASYGNRRVRDKKTEGSFGKSITAGDELREELEKGWVDGMDGINRYLSASEITRRKFSAEVMSMTTLSLPNNQNGLKLIASGSYDKSDNTGENFSNYLLQYRGQQPTEMKRSNPQESHGYQYILAVEWFKPVSQYVDIRPRVDFFNIYNYNLNEWLTATDEETASRKEALPSMRRDALLRIDPRNSYVAGEHSNNLRPRFTVNYFKNMNDGVMTDASVFASFEAEASIRRSRLDFHGIQDTRVGRNYVSPGLNAVGKYQFNKLNHQIQVNYNFSGRSIDVFNLLDVVFDYDPLNRRTGNAGLKQEMTHTVSVSYFNNNWMLNRVRMYVDMRYKAVKDGVAMSYSYDRENGVKTYRPVNLDGNRSASLVMSPTIALDRGKKLQLVDYLKLESNRSVDMVSYDDFASTQQSIVKTRYIFESLSLRYSVKKFMVALDGQIETRHVNSTERYFEPFRITEFRYGARGRVSLPASFELSTDLKMYSTRGFDYREMNTNQLVWNGRITKMLLDGKLMIALDGYDILGKVKSISYNINAQGRTETWINSIPSYVMLSVRWNFTKKPRE